jgi:hypothetical protein
VAGDDKPYDIEMEHRDGYLHVIVGGLRVTPEIALDYWHDILAECDKIGCSKIFLEHNFVEMISMEDMTKVIGPVTELLKGHMLAFYDRQGHYDIPEAGKKIMRSHDVKMQIFHDVKEAERWLLAN